MTAVGSLLLITRLIAIGFHSPVPASRSTCYLEHRTLTLRSASTSHQELAPQPFGLSTAPPGRFALDG